MQPEINDKLTNPISAGNGTRNADEKIKKVNKMRGYKMGGKEINVLWYADTAAMITENEDEL